MLLKPGTKNVTLADMLKGECCSAPSNKGLGEMLLFGYYYTHGDINCFGDCKKSSHLPDDDLLKVIVNAMAEHRFVCLRKHFKRFSAAFEISIRDHVLSLNISFGDGNKQTA